MESSVDFHGLSIKLTPTDRWSNGPDDEPLFDAEIVLKPGVFFGTLQLNAVFFKDDMRKFVESLKASPTNGSHRLGGHRGTLVQLDLRPVNETGEQAHAECTVIPSEADPQELFRFSMWHIDQRTLLDVADEIETLLSKLKLS